MLFANKDGWRGIGSGEIVASLNWRANPIHEQEVSSHPERHNQMTIGIGEETLTEFCQALRETLREEMAAELRVDLPRNWILFWKRREGESRLLLAHPRVEEWVATLSLSGEHAEALLGRLESMISGDILKLSELASVASMSNLEFVLKIY